MKKATRFLVAFFMISLLNLYYIINFSSYYKFMKKQKWE